MAPRRSARIHPTASCGDKPSSTNATATSTGARPRPAAQWMATVVGFAGVGGSGVVFLC